MPFEIQLQLCWGKKKQEKWEGWVLEKATKKEGKGRMKEKRQKRKRAIEGCAAVCGRVSMGESEWACSTGASPPAVRDLHRLSFI